ncbi:FadR/GntR family transcriptional regulator [Uliginosibacterium aquaticum]|uniref:FadR family transcriptional regulator n=1 Tax=Uliginosibacterium aquaticum TaxID=2731212 RepID=A0ABX2IJB4_9RHOO|nr:FadR/GntR family transcriptional regulator [Uliginosibacterium aquaticum]NSL56926.1 FadR family transcriptional regulator [Uliginosibacterium aquaticum]
MNKARPRETLTGQLTRTLAERITSGQYAVGTQLPSEQKMISEFGVSRTVVREAIANLRANGRVLTRQGSGAFVLQQEAAKGFHIDSGHLTDIQEVVSLLELRIGLESEAAVLAAQRRTPEQLEAMKQALRDIEQAILRDENALEPDLRFHRLIAEAAGNPHFLKLFHYVSELLMTRASMRPGRLSSRSPEEFLNHAQREHEQICFAIERQDPEAARAALRMHLSESKARLLRSAALHNP